MPRKRDRHTSPEGLLQRVITALEQSDEPNHPSHRQAVMLLLTKGPLLTQALDQEPDVPDEWFSLVRAELVAFLRQAVRLQGSTYFGNGISLYQRVEFFAKLVQDRVFLEAKGEPRDIAILQMLLLLEQVGLRNVRTCGASDCSHLFVKTYRREFCSLRCQQRTTKARNRHDARVKLEQQARARRRRVATKGRR